MMGHTIGFIPCKRFKITTNNYWDVFIFRDRTEGLAVAFKEIVGQADIEFEFSSTLSIEELREKLNTSSIDFKTLTRFKNIKIEEL